LLRTEDPRFLTTGGEYTEDLVDDRLAGAAHAFFVRSPVAHARITGIDLDAARATAGVVAVFTAADLTHVDPISPLPGYAAGMTQTLLASDTVRYVGEPVAMVVVEDP
jgi:carbon-monoxide dehydrogenase large subunit